MTRHSPLLAALSALLLPACAAGPWTPPDEAPLPAGFPAPSPPGVVVVKEYPAWRGAFHRWEGRLEAGPRRAFWPLFEHIRSNDIAMSAPVQAEYPSDVEARDAGAMEVGFLYVDPARQPASVAEDVRVVDGAPVTVASLGVEGRYDMDVMRPALARLREWLEENGSAWRAAGPPRRLFYQQPIFWKGARIYSEVQIPIEPVPAP